MDTEEFGVWLSREISYRGWSESELARRAKLSQSSISSVLSGINKPGRKFCNGIAEAFGLEPSLVMRIAGLLPPAPECNVQSDTLISYFADLDQHDKNNVIVIVRALREEAKRRVSPSQPKRQIKHRKEEQTEE